MKREVTVTVFGRAGNGKTSVANLIANALLNAGITVVKPPEPDGDNRQTGEDVADAINHLNSHGFQVTVLTQHVKTTPPPLPLPDTVRVPLDSLHADAGYLCGRLLNGTMTQEQVVASIRRRIDEAKEALK